MLLSASLKSRYVERKYVDFSGLTSSYKEEIFADFSLISTSLLNPNRDFELKSQMLDRSGDFSLSSSFVFTFEGDFSLRTSYRIVNTTTSFGLDSLFSVKEYVDFDYDGVIIFSYAADFSIKSNFSMAKLTDFTFKSRLIEGTNRDFSFLSRLKKLSLVHREYLLESSFIERSSLIPFYIDETSPYTSNPFTISSYGYIPSTLYHYVGELSVEVSNILEEVTSPSIRLSTEANSTLLPIYKNLGNISTPYMDSFGGIISDFCDVSFSPGELNEITSNAIEFVIERHFEEATILDEDIYSLKMYIGKFSQSSIVYSSFIEWSAYFINGFISGFSLYDIFILPELNTGVSTVLLDDYSVTFGVEKPSSIESISGIVQESCIAGYIDGLLFKRVFIGNALFYGTSIVEHYKQDFYLNANILPEIIQTSRIHNKIYKFSINGESLDYIYHMEQNEFVSDGRYISDTTSIDMFDYSHINSSISRIRHVIVSDYSEERIIWEYDENAPPPAYTYQNGDEYLELEPGEAYNIEYLADYHSAEYSLFAATFLQTFQDGTYYLALFKNWRIMFLDNYTKSLTLTMLTSYNNVMDSRYSIDFSISEGYYSVGQMSSCYSVEGLMVPDSSVNEEDWFFNIATVKVSAL